MIEQKIIKIHSHTSNGKIITKFKVSGDTEFLRYCVESSLNHIYSPFIENEMIIYVEQGSEFDLLFTLQSKE
jgi:hypothetical protein